MTTTYVALFRGMNVGGNNVIRMKDLAALFEEAGHSCVRTYIQSGNVVFTTSAGTEKTLTKQIAAALRRSRGFEPRVIVLTLAALKKTASANPFPEAAADPTSVHIFFLAERAIKANVTAMERAKAKSERFALKGNAFYLYAPDGLGRSKLAASCERHLGVDTTARNWRTVTRLIELAESARADAEPSQ